MKALALALGLMLAGPALAALPLQSPLPDASYPDLSGRTVTLSALKGKPVLVNLWATWCQPCVHELPILVDLHERYAADGLRVVGVSLDVDLAVLERAVEKYRLPYTILHDATSTVTKPFQVGQLPATFLFDAQGRLVWQLVDELDPNDPGFRAALKRVMPQSGPKGTDARLKPLKAVPSPLPPAPIR